MDAERMVPTLLGTVVHVPDPRSPHGRRHPLPTTLARATAAMHSGARSLYAVAQWGRLQPPAVAAALRFAGARPPTVSTLHAVLWVLDAAAFEAALAGWARANLSDRRDVIAIDGKGLRGLHGKGLPVVRLVAVDTNGAGLVPTQAGGQRR